MQNIDTHSLEFYSRRVEEISTNLSPIQEKLYSTAAVPDLTYQERYLLRTYLLEMSVASEALQTEVALLKDELKKPIWKRILKK